MFQWTNPRDVQNTLSVKKTARGIWVSVSEEKAADGGNIDETCEIDIPLAEARVLRDYLNRVLGKPT